ncbi:MAG TPA: succinylglutamate desuccinylase/aspartoacylase family protein [Devosia sp.]|jgi:hypothetical protein|nr:succinylglutamate desuccinylase/aspartoacylase family protein [Devosia sp.]
MAFTLDALRLAGDTPGTIVELPVYRVGPDSADRKVYLQAALHADEQPGTMVLHHLLPMLRKADEQNLLRARFVLVPMANPLGMANFVHRTHLGRYDLTTGVNYNRQWPDLFAAVGAEVADRLGDDAQANTRAIRDAVAGWIAEQQPRSATQQLRMLLLREAHDADVVLDLHCDSDSLNYIYTSPEFMPGLQDLADWMGAAAVMTAADSGGGSFDEVLPLLYRKVAGANPGKPVPMASATATLEYRGQNDVFDQLGEQDALRLFGFLCGRGLVDADPGPVPSRSCEATPFEATEIIRAGSAGIVAYRAELGQRVTKGEPIADLIAVDGPEAFIGRTPIVAGTDGLLLTRSLRKYVTRGENIAKIVGTTPLPQRRGYLLED